MKLIVTILDWLIADRRPTRMVDSYYFHKVMALGPRYNVRTGKFYLRNAIPRACARIENATHEIVEKEVESFFGTIDLWTSEVSYFLVTIDCN